MSRHNKRRQLPLGPVHHGSHRYEELMPSLLAAAKSIRMSGDDWASVCCIAGDFHSNHEGQRRAIHAAEPGIASIEDRRESDLDYMIKLLNDYIPDMCYFGLGMGDGGGADYGVWPSAEVPFHEPATDSIGKSDELPNAKEVSQDHWLVVTDHGNCTLYTKVRCGKGYRWSEQWSMV